MNILITGARAPIAADLARVLAAEGHRVWTADSLRFPIGRFSAGIRGYLQIPAPRDDFRAFSRAITGACQELRIDRIIPTSEEVFWLAAVKLPAGCVGFYPDRQVLAQLHDKAHFSDLAERLGYGSGHHKVLESKEQLEWFMDSRPIDQYVLKPVFSRFGTKTILRPTRLSAGAVSPTPQSPWLAQRRAEGTELCAYNIAVDGKIILHAAYRPIYRVGAGVYFEPVQDSGLLRMCEALVWATGATGQISFDAIRTSQGIVAIECNPRGTSGVHLAAQNPARLVHALLGRATPGHEPYTPSMLALAMVAGNPGAIFRREGRAAWRAAGDAMSAARIPVWAQALATGEMLARASKTNLSLIESMTQDFEWNGEAIGDAQ